MSLGSSVKAVCPLFHFKISPSPLVEKHTKEELRKYVSNLRERVKKGIHVFGDVKIRLITKKELERLRDYSRIGFYSNAISQLSHETFVVELSMKDVDREEAITKLFKILLALRLYKENDVFIKILFYKNKPEATHMTIFDSPLPERMPYPYSVEIEEVEEFKKFIAKVYKTDFDTRGSLRIACERFSRSCEEYKNDEKIIDFMIAFEALFKSEKVYSNIGKFIGLGCSMLLGENEEEREDINEFLTDAYWIRNKIVHGSEPTVSNISGPPISIKVHRNKHRKTYEIQDVISRLQKYLRESIKKLM